MDLMTINLCIDEDDELTLTQRQDDPDYTIETINDKELEEDLANIELDYTLFDTLPQDLDLPSNESTNIQSPEQEEIPKKKHKTEITFTPPTRTFSSPLPEEHLSTVMEEQKQQLLKQQLNNSHKTKNWDPYDDQRGKQSPIKRQFYFQSQNNDYGIKRHLIEEKKKEQIMKVQKP
ncbi:MAG: hypothetical protein GY772_17780, partial [bacterium]|nr:hypothetical protein [bacterium]